MLRRARSRAPPDPQVTFESRHNNPTGAPHSPNAHGIQHPRRGGIDVRTQALLNTTLSSNTCRACMAFLRSGQAGGAKGGRKGTRSCRRLATWAAPSAPATTPARTSAKAAPDQGQTQHALTPRALHPCVHRCLPHRQQLVVLHARRTGAFAMPTANALVQMLLRGASRGMALKHLLHQINAAPWSVKLIARQLVGRTGGITKPQCTHWRNTALGLTACWLILKFGSELGLHDKTSQSGTEGINRRSRPHLRPVKTPLEGRTRSAPCHASVA